MRLSIPGRIPNALWMRFGHLSRVDVFAEDFVSQQAPIVLGGCARSGTTLVRVLLDSHPAIFCGPETGLFALPQLELHHLHAVADRYGLARAVVRNLYRHTHSRGQFVDRFFALCCEDRGTKRWAEKTPKNVQNIAAVFKCFPQARFIHVIRDGRDVACSLRTHPKYRKQRGEWVETGIRVAMDQCAARWVRDVRAGLRHRDDPRYLEVRYEDLVNQTRATMEKLLEFVGEPWDERVLQHTTVDSSLRDVNTFLESANAVKPINHTALGRWREELTGTDRETFQAIAGELMLELGYVSKADWS